MKWRGNADELAAMEPHNLVPCPARCAPNLRPAAVCLVDLLPWTGGLHPTSRPINLGTC